MDNIHINKRLNPKGASIGADLAPDGGSSFSKPDNTRKSKLPISGQKRLIVAVVILATVIIGLVLLSKFTKFNVLGLSQGSKYHAVFLTNGQVYFGHLKGAKSSMPILTDIYYLRLKDGGLQQQISQPAGQQPELTLSKFGTELHAPTDMMVLNRDHVLFYEYLQTDSRVVKAIIDYEASGE